MKSKNDKTHWFGSNTRPDNELRPIVVQLQFSSQGRGAICGGPKNDKTNPFSDKLKFYNVLYGNQRTPPQAVGHQRNGGGGITRIPPYKNVGAPRLESQAT
jgi:hypothetical protein